jgi:RNA polymerase sigma factor (sigma-70 family)
MNVPATAPGLDSPDDLPPLLAQLEPRFHSMLRFFRIPPADAEDLVQTTALLALLHWDQIRQPVPWLVGTLRNRCLVYHRDRRQAARRQVHVEDRTAPGDAGDPDALNLPPLPPLPARREPLDARIDLHRLLRGFPPRHRLLLAARYQLGMADHEVAAVTGLATGSVRKVIHRALADVRAAARLEAGGLGKSGRR